MTPNATPEPRPAKRARRPRTPEQIARKERCDEMLKLMDDFLFDPMEDTIKGLAVLGLETIQRMRHDTGRQIRRGLRGQGASVEAIRLAMGLTPMNVPGTEGIPRAEFTPGDDEWLRQMHITLEDDAISTMPGTR